MNNSANKTSHEEKGICISERELSYLVVAAILGALLIFVAGYFLGKKRMYEELVIRDDIQFADKVRSAFSSNSSDYEDIESGGEGDDDEGEEREESRVAATAQTTSPAKPKAVVATEQPTTKHKKGKK